nr:regucalcin-like [Penaeus vannamei]
MDSNLKVSKWATSSLSNGLAWSLDRKTFYFVDSHPRTIDAFDYDDESGAISNRRVVFDFYKAGLKDQFPDGMAIDVDGNLWVASFGGYQVLCVNPRTGRILRRVAIPAKNVSSVCWGGPDYSTLFVTSGTLGMSPEEVAANPSSGGTFAVTGPAPRASPGSLQGRLPAEAAAGGCVRDRGSEPQLQLKPKGEGKRVTSWAGGMTSQAIDGKFAFSGI